MAIVAGLDEAGYGPLLGPLVITGVAFSVPDAEAESSLWQILKHSVTPRLSAKDRRLPIVDSKKLYASKAKLGALERTALVMLRTCGRQPTSLRGLLKVVAPESIDDLASYPWYDGFDVGLPTRCNEAEIATRANAVSRDMNANGMHLFGVYAEPLMAGHYNRLITSVRNKAVVALGVVLRVVQHILSSAGEERVIINLDRQSGRTHYRHQLMTSFPTYHLRIVEEGAARSAYELDCEAASHRLTFVTNGENHHLPIALASIYSKYLRELFMAGLNDYWARQVHGLKPTAGYYTDAHRFLRDIQGAAASQRVNRSLLVRSR